MRGKETRDQNIYYPIEEYVGPTLVTPYIGDTEDANN